MIDTGYVLAMAQYNAWQNTSLYSASDRIGNDERRKDRGAFFGSIHHTLSHLLWGDQMWMSRFANIPKPDASIADSPAMVPQWDDLKNRRQEMDAKITGWAKSMNRDFLESDMTWFSGAERREITKPVWLLVVHMFNHQTHHRGQVHAMITSAGGKPEPTDLFVLEHE